MSSSSPATSSPSALDLAQAAALDAVGGQLVRDAQSWGARIRCCLELIRVCERQEAAGVPQFRALEMAGAWRVSQITAERWLAEAERFGQALPLTLSMLERGELLVHQASAVLHRLSGCAPEVARRVEAEVLPAGAALCPSDLGRRLDRVRLRRESEQRDAEEAERRHAEQVARRRTFLRPESDGMGIAGAVLPAEQLAAWKAGLDALERRERVADRKAGVERTAEQRRADLFAALPAMVLAGMAQDEASARAGEAPRPWTCGPDQLAATVIQNVHVPVSTVLDLSRAPGSIDGFGPVSAEHVRLVRPHGFRRVMVDAETGRPIAVDDRVTTADPDPVRARQQVQDMLRPDVVVDAEELQHDPSACLARLVDLRDVHCAGPGCCSRRTDRDHLLRYPDGPTSAANLGRLSPRCHRAKHHGWTLVRHPDGSVTWRSPLRRSYDRPSPHDPPPEVDVYAPPPPVRRRPQVAPPWDVPDDAADDDLLAPAPKKPPVQWDDPDQPLPF